MRSWRRAWRTAAVFLASLGVLGLFIGLASVKDGFDTADKVSSVWGAVFGAVALGLSWYSWRRAGPESDPQAVASRLAKKVVRVEEDALRQLLGGSLGSLIDVSFRVTVTGAVAAPPAAADGDWRGLLHE
ncbi:hypothetical protein ABZ371_09035 [Streptomyces sp. NPDC005899]|uniref:hypothetical protein n=1 Tax=Streptomyces sp. NPDC005899 TaxID=3155716 RepID=UPI0033C1C71B